MKHLLSPALRAFIAKHSFVILLVLFLAWMCIGIFPLHCYESDSMHTIAGCYTLLNQGFTIPPIYSYEYHMQPLIYYLVAGMSYLFSFLSCEEMFCLLTGIAAILTILVSIRFVYRITGIRREYILFALFLLPESVAIGMYPNTAIFAMLPFMLALNYFLSRRFIPAIAWMCLAPLFRIDILMVYPVILFIFLWQKDTFITALKKSLLSAVIIVAVLVVCYWGVQANPLDSTLKGYGKWNEEITPIQSFYAIFSFYTALGFFLFPLGIYRLYKQKAYRLLLLVLVPVILNHIVYARMGCATKHYLYIYPFVAVSFAWALSFLVSWLRGRGIWRYVAWAALVIFLFVSIRISVPSRPWLSIKNAESQFTCLTLCTEHISPLNLSVGIGAGFVVKTLDEKMLASGNAFYPLYVNQLKRFRKQARQEAYTYLSQKGGYNLWGISWEEVIYLPLLFMADGYAFDKTIDQQYSLEKENRIIKVLNKSMDVGNVDTAGRERMIANGVVAMQSLEKPIYVFTVNDSFRYFFDRLVAKNVITKCSEGLYLLHSQNN